MPIRWAVMALLIVPAFGYGEELDSLTKNPQLTLPEVIEKAYLRSPRQHVLNAGQTVAQARATHANSLLPAPPAISFRHQNDTIGSNRNLSEWEAGVELPVWMPGQRSARASVAREAEAGLATSRQELKLELAGQVREAVWDLTMTTSNAALAEDRLNTAQSLQSDVEKRWKAGELAKTDVMLAQNETLQARTALLRAQAEVKHAEHRYWMLTGLKEFPAVLEERPVDRSEIDDDHPALAEMAARIQLARNERDLVQVERRENPQITINARHDRGAFDNQFNSSLGLAVRIPLDAQVRAAPLVAGAEMNLAQAMNERDQRLITLQASLHESEHNLEVTRAELDIVENQHKLAQENLRLAKKAFDLGEFDLVTLLRARAMAQEAERSLSSRRIQLQWNIARHHQALGVLP